MTAVADQLLGSLGFRFGINGPHAARTMMLGDLRALLSYTRADATRADYERAILEENVLGKATQSARKLAFRHLATLYALSDNNPIFRVMRRLWSLDESAQPILALAMAVARDPLLRETQAFVLGHPIGTQITRERFEEFLGRQYPQRFTPASLRSFAQNVAGTWTAAGLLTGHRRKIRAHPVLRPESTALLLFLAYLQGRSGQRLFTSNWMALLCSTRDDIQALTNAASHRGLLVYMRAGGIEEVRFPGYLTSEEERVRVEVSHVV